MHIDRILDGGGGGGVTNCFNNLINQNPNYATFVFTSSQNKEFSKNLPAIMPGKFLSLPATLCTARWALYGSATEVWSSGLLAHTPVCNI